MLEIWIMAGIGFVFLVLSVLAIIAECRVGKRRMEWHLKAFQRKNPEV